VRGEVPLLVEERSVDDLDREQAGEHVLVDAEHAVGHPFEPDELYVEGVLKGDPQGIE
jgi:hypothetical protein